MNADNDSDFKRHGKVQLNDMKDLTRCKAAMVSTPWLDAANENKAHLPSELSRWPAPWRSSWSNARERKPILSIVDLLPHPPAQTLSETASHSCSGVSQGAWCWWHWDYHIEVITPSRVGVSSQQIVSKSFVFPACSWQLFSIVGHHGNSLHLDIKTNRSHVDSCHSCPAFAS